MSTFDQFWREVINPAIDSCIKDLDAQIIDELEIQCYDKTRYKEELKELFAKKREWLKREYLPDEGANAILDFHKLSAILCRIVVGNKPFIYSTEKANKYHGFLDGLETLTREEKIKLEINTIYINYKCAYLVGVGVAYIDLYYWVKKKYSDCSEESSKKLVYEEFIKSLDKLNTMVDYYKSPHHDDFNTSMIISLMKNDQLMRDFDYLLFAASMFQWQEYTKQTILNEILCDPDRNQGFSVLDLESFIKS